LYFQPTGPGAQLSNQERALYSGPSPIQKATGKKEGINSHEKNTQKERIFTMAKGLVHWHIRNQSGVSTTYCDHKALGRLL